jgi:hypothetical protein
MIANDKTYRNCTTESYGKNLSPIELLNKKYESRKLAIMLLEDHLRNFQSEIDQWSKTFIQNSVMNLKFERQKIARTLKALIGY